ncbi:hypothetical protein COV18_02120 [Candidatus Woesearchaeota archaeon CG10_big_fil_rev_8_21_14_0_10_37_12]|nr:MAG: hypothetical protein COV18_02120 [Candidatus Woesearchaeota archaeon CG10_big_fil_rev_8_21_14_0_10_37_12]
MRKVPDIDKLKRICWRNPPDLYRRFSIYVVWCALKFGARANHITLLRVIVLVFGFICFLSSTWFFWILGVLLYQLCVFLDTMDGAIARYNKESSLIGEFMDVLLDHLSSNLVYFISAGIAAHNLTGSYLFIWASLITVVASHYATFIRGIYREYVVNVDLLKKKSLFFSFFHQDNMRFLLVLLSLTVLISIKYQLIFVILNYVYFGFVFVKSIFLTVHFMRNTSHNPFERRMIFAYFALIFYLAYSVFCKFFRIDFSQVKEKIKSKYKYSRLVNSLIK